MLQRYTMGLAFNFPVRRILGVVDVTLVSRSTLYMSSLDYTLVGWNGQEPIQISVEHNDSVIKVEPDSAVTNYSAEFTMISQNAGHSLVMFNTSDPSVREVVLLLDREMGANVPCMCSTSWAFIRVDVFRMEALVWVSTIVGWLYFAAWSVSFYPQTYTNFKRKSVVGLHFDFLALNLSGFLSYSIYNFCFYYSTIVQDEYHKVNPTGVVPVELNDVVFAVHAFIATVIQIIQCFIYDRGNQTMSKMAIGFLSLGWLGAGIFLILTLTGVNCSWLYFLYYFSNFKLVITIIKYIPQAVYNYRRKSTQGWSIGNILLDLTGGTLSILQMFVISINFNDWYYIFGNFAKLGLGLVSILFDFVFIYQHYFLYWGRSAQEDMEEEARKYDEMYDD
ncbi:CTNS [Cordylochernes scorpioides]|uniref:CTNS n=1 Tax=Cordylochernes scorpioides TaxID=51811 RepID=A0ABY6KAH6_9ARAC|nr:CTNS [Cordylochernes scorpioides]